MKKTTKKISALLLAAVMTVSLAACGKTAPPAPNSSESAPTSDGGAGQSADKNTGSTDSFDLATTEFKYAGEFSEGYAWVREKDSTIYYLIDRNGKKCSQYDYGEKVTSDQGAPLPVQDGASFIPELNNGTIVDTQGNELYTLSHTDENTEQFRACGDGYYLIRREKKSFDSNETGYVVINKNGEDQTPLVTEIERDADCQYLSDGVFSVSARFIDPKNPAGLVPYPKDGDFSYSIISKNDYNNNIARSEKGKTWVSMDDNTKPNGSVRGIALVDAHTFDFTHISTTNSKNYGSYAVADNVYYDIDGNKTDISLYGDKAVNYSPISDKGLIAVSLLGEDNSYYLAYVDTQGKEVTAPFKFQSQFAYGYEYDEDHYCIFDNGNLTVYNPDGTQVTQIAVDSDGDKGWLRLAKDYVICKGKYYFF